MRRRFRMFALLTTGLLTVADPLSAQSNTTSSRTVADLLVYEDDLQAPWFHNTYNTTVTLVSNEQAYAGTASMKVTSTVAWGWVSMHHGPWNTQGFSPDPYKSLDFAVYATSYATSLGITFENDQGQTFPKIARGTFTPNAWTAVSIPMSDLNPNGQSIGRVFIQDFSGTTKTFYIDNLRFVATTSSSTPAAPTPTSPQDGATGVSVNPTLSWNASVGADSYRLQVSTTGGFVTTDIDQSGITGTSSSISGLSNSTTYYWRVSARNTAGASGWSQVRSFTTVAGPVSAPTLASPEDGATGVSVNPTLSWNASTGAESYRLQVSTSSTFVATDVDQSGIAGTSMSVSGLSNSTTYYWRVNAQNTDGASGWSQVWNFTTIAGPLSEPALTSPPDRATNQSWTLMLTCQSVPGADSYRLQVSISSSFSNTVLDEQSISGTSRQVRDLSPNTQYYWRVNARNSSATSGWSPVWSFTTVAVPLSAPSLASPADGATNQSRTLTLSWNSVAGAQTYRLQVSTARPFPRQ